MLTARLIHFALPHPPNRPLLGVSPPYLAKAFVAADILSFAIQAAGGSMIADQEDVDRVEVGQKVYMAGIGTQLFFVLIFCVFAGAFWVRLRRERYAIRGGGKEEKGVWRILFSVFAVLLLIVVSPTTDKARPRI